VFFLVVGNDGVFLRASLFPENQWRLMGIYTKLAVSFGTSFLPKNQWRPVGSYSKLAVSKTFQMPYIFWD